MRTLHNRVSDLYLLQRFDVAYDENPQRGERRRQWASCMVPGFSDMVGGHSFRQSAGERLRYRALHKVNDYKARNGIEHMCVGCGRCDDRCPQYIKFSRIINKMTAAVRQALSGRHNLCQRVPVMIKKSTAFCLLHTALFPSPVIHHRSGIFVWKSIFRPAGDSLSKSPCHASGRRPFLFLTAERAG